MKYCFKICFSGLILFIYYSIDYPSYESCSYTPKYHRDELSFHEITFKQTGAGCKAAPFPFWTILKEFKFMSCWHGRLQQSCSIFSTHREDRTSGKSAMLIGNIPNVPAIAGNSINKSLKFWGYSSVQLRIAQYFLGADIQNGVLYCRIWYEFCNNRSIKYTQPLYCDSPDVHTEIMVRNGVESIWKTK